MLPVPQISPGAVSNPQTFDARPTPYDQEGRDLNLLNPWKLISSKRRSLPIRTSHYSNEQVASSPSHRASTTPEHSLRRKTPGGTIISGYDGSFTQACPNLPPSKYTILPASLKPRGYPWPGPVLGSTQQDRGQPFRPHNGEQGSRRAGTSSSPAWAYNDAYSSAIYDALGLHRNHPFHEEATQHPNIDQPVLRAHEQNVRAFCPPPAAISSPLLSGHTGWQLESPPRDCRQHRATSHSTIYDTRLDTPSALGPSHDTMSQVHLDYIGNHLVPTTVKMNPQKLYQSTQPYRDISSLHSPQRTSSYGQFFSLQTALQHSHQSYINLLSFLHANGKTHPTLKTPGAFDSHSLPAYPKPPQLPTLAKFIGADVLVPSMSINDVAFKSPAQARNLDLDSGHRPHHISTFHNVVSRTDINAHVRPHQPVASNSDSIVCNGKNTISETPVAISNALCSLEALKFFCHSCDWKWVEGALLGGCLHYGLEQYEDAIEWFSKVISLDSSHVEAITHLGAAQYCIGHQDEAEKNWLIAIKLQPDFLDATEHLVSHLYKNRSREAIEVIGFVQQSLRFEADDPNAARSQKSSMSYLHDDSCTMTFHPTSNQDSLSGAFDNDTGFASSGYRLHGRDNGRILALVHAKATMLYSRKEIELASENFQEAVLISVGRRVSSIQELVGRIRSALLPQGLERVNNDQTTSLLKPLMLPPERALHTARLVFGRGGELPGLYFLRGGMSKGAAVQTASNSLLSLAKILQDAVASGNAASCLFSGSSQVGDILSLYYLSLSLQESPSTANNVGILLAGIQQANVTSASAPAKGSPLAVMPGVVPGSGLALALAYYKYGLYLDSNHVHLHTNLGSLLKDVGQLDLAIHMYERAVSCDGTFDIALTNLANAVKDKGRIHDSIIYYRRAVNVNPRFAEAVCGLFTALNSICNWHGRGGVMLESGRYDRWHVDGDGKLVDVHTAACGSGLTKRVVDIVAQQLGEASQWGVGILQDAFIEALAKQLQCCCRDPDFKLNEALRRWAGQPWEGSRLLRLIERATRIMQKKWYSELYLTKGNTVVPYVRPRLPQNLAAPAAPTVLPFHTFTCPLSANHIRAIAQRNALRISCSTFRSSWISSMIYPPPPPPSPHLNVGYISSDFNNHPLAHLMQSAFGFHNPTRVRAICYATTPSDGSIHRQQIEQEAPVFRDVHNWPADRLIDQISQDKIHILVNLNGYTRGARNEIFAARPAPIQMSFMGFAGTLGAEWCDYILADEIAIPATTLRPCRDNMTMEDIFRDDNESAGGSWVYAENVIFCRETFFCCDHAQSCAADASSANGADFERQRWTMRKDLFPNIGNDVVILGNFNQLYKIEPTTFRSWLRILARVPRAIMWLLRFPEPGESNLRATASAWAGPDVASRIYFTDVAPKNQHISRAQVCDLFLDTPECNAHTTAADVLWSSTPLLTLPRYPYKMCSRMAASILRGALPKSPEGEQAASKLIAGTEEEYEQRAVELATDLTYALDGEGVGRGKGHLADIRKLLLDSKWQCGLFNTRRWVGDLELAYEEAWRRWVSGDGGDIFL